MSEIKNTVRKLKKKKGDIESRKAWRQTVENDLSNIVVDVSQKSTRLHKLVDNLSTKLSKNISSLESQVKKVSKQIGPKGDKGDKGDKGEKGDKGDKGEDGKDGRRIEPKEIVKKLESLRGNNRLDAKAIKNLERYIKNRNILIQSLDLDEVKDYIYRTRRINLKATYTEDSTIDSVASSHKCDSETDFTLTVTDGTKDGECIYIRNINTCDVTLSGNISSVTATKVLYEGESLALEWDSADSEWQ